MRVPPLHARGRGLRGGPSLCLCLLFAAAACQTTPPDPDGQPGGARLLPMGALHADQLHCRAGDCADWFRLEVQQPGDLIVLLESPEAAQGDGRPLSVALADGRGRQLEAVRVSPTQGEALLRWQAKRGYYMVRVESRDEARSALPYELELRLVLPPPPAPPPRGAKPPAARIQTVVGEVLEVEGDIGDPNSVLIDRGETHGILPGQVGRLLNGEEMIATVVVVDTYPEGSRARIEGTLSAPILPTTRVEIDVPVEAAGQEGL